MARIWQNIRNERGQYVKVTFLNKLKALCNRVIMKIEAWTKSVEKT